MKKFINKTEKPLPGLGLVRTHRDTYLNEVYYNRALRKRNKHCFNYELKLRCNTYKCYKRYMYNKKEIHKILCNKLNHDVVNYLFEYYEVEQHNFIQELDYRFIIPNMKYKWYIIISNILYIVKERHHQEILHINKIMFEYEKYVYSLEDITYDEKVRLFMNEFCKIYLYEDSLSKKYNYDNIVDLAKQVKDEIRNRMIEIYYEIRL